MYSIDVPSRKLVVIDPCYEPDDLRNLGYVIYFKEPGTINVSVDKGKFNLFGERVKKIIISGLEITSMTGDEAGVDSGQMLLMDYDEYINTYREEFEGFSDDLSYEKVCDVSMSKDYGKVSKKSFVTSTGFGDGVYYLEKITKFLLEMKFIPDDYGK